MTKITEGSHSPEYMKGIINLRGSVLPVIDTRIKFGLPDKEYTDNTCIVVIDLELDGETIHIGSIVDEVVSVIEIPKNDIQDPPSIESKYKFEFIHGMAKVEEQFIMLLDLQQVLDREEMSQLVETSKADLTQEA